MVSRQHSGFLLPVSCFQTHRLQAEQETAPASWAACELVGKRDEGEAEPWLACWLTAVGHFSVRGGAAPLRHLRRTFLGWKISWWSSAL